MIFDLVSIWAFSDMYRNYKVYRKSLKSIVRSSNLVFIVWLSWKYHLNFLFLFSSESDGMPTYYAKAIKTGQSYMNIVLFVQALEYVV